MAMTKSPESNQQVFDIESYPQALVKKLNEFDVSVETFSQIVRSETTEIHPVRSGIAEIQSQFRRCSRQWFNNLSRRKKNVVLREVSRHRAFSHAADRHMKHLKSNGRYKFDTMEIIIDFDDRHFIAIKG